MQPVWPTYQPRTCPRYKHDVRQNPCGRWHWWRGIHETRDAHSADHGSLLTPPSADAGTSLAASYCGFSVPAQDTVTTVRYNLQVTTICILPTDFSKTGGKPNKTWEANVEMIHILHTKKTPLKSSPLHNQPSQNLRLLHALFQLNNCTMSASSQSCNLQWKSRSLKLISNYRGYWCLSSYSFERAQEAAKDISYKWGSLL